MARLQPGIMIATALAGLALGLGAVVLASGATWRADAAAPPAAAAGTPEEALAAFVRRTGGTFAGPCEQTRSPDDIGKLCDRFVEERGGRRAYLLGRTFSEFDTWVFLRHDAGGWTAVASAPLDFRATTLTIPWPR